MTGMTDHDEPTVEDGPLFDLDPTLFEILSAPFETRPRRSERTMATLFRLNRMDEVSQLYRQWIAKEVTLGYVQLAADLTDEESETLYKGRDDAMRIDRFGRVTYDEPTLLRAVCAVVGD